MLQTGDAITNYTHWPQTCCCNQVQRQLEPFYSDYNPAIAGMFGHTAQRQLIWWERNLRRSHFIARSVCVPFNHSWQIWNCAENMATRQERGRERKGNESERRVRSEHAWKASKAAREDLWEPHIFTLGTRLLCCLERLLLGDWSHPPGSLRPLSPPPLQTLVCDYLLSLPPILCMKSTTTHTHALRHIQSNCEYINKITRVCLHVTTILSWWMRLQTGTDQQEKVTLNCTKHKNTFFLTN